LTGSKTTRAPASAAISAVRSVELLSQTIFNVDDDGRVDSVSEVHVSGRWRFDRVE
jgi:hypothetical protein